MTSAPNGRKASIPVVSGSKPGRQHDHKIDAVGEASRATRWESNIRKAVAVVSKTYEFYGLKSLGDQGGLASNKKMGINKKRKGYTWDEELSVWVHDQTVTHWFGLTKGGDLNWVKVVKWKLNAFFSAHHDQEIPTPVTDVEDNPSILLGGAGYKFVGNLKRYKTPDERMLMESFFTSIANAKRGMPAVHSEMVEQGVKDTVETLTTSKPIERQPFLLRWEDTADWEPDRRISITLRKEDVEEQVARTVREVFGEDPITDAERIRAFMPSTSAYYINNRKKGGAIGALYNGGFLAEFQRPGGYLRVKERERKEEERNPDEDFIAMELDDEASVYSANLKELEEAFAQLWIKLLDHTDQEENVAVPVGLSEALKVRVITKGPPVRQTVLRNLWKVMHNRMRRHKAFRMTGEVIDEWNVLDTVGRNLKEGFVYASVDYADATNQIRSFCSNAFAKEAARCLKLDQQEERAVRVALTEHMIEQWVTAEEMTELQAAGKDFVHIEYVEKFELHRIHRPQREGQLMGSIVSFVGLCMVNAAICRWAKELGERRYYRLDQCQLGVNGDDAVMTMNARTISFWRKISTFVGLKESVGKTYFSSDFLQMNSMNYVVWHEEFTAHSRNGEKKERMTRLKEVKYVNMGLVTGTKRSGEKSDLKDLDDPHQNIGSRARMLKELCPEGLFESVYEIFIRQHWSLLTRLRVPWFIPEWLGGLGLPITASHRPSELDLRQAAVVLRGWREKRPIHLATGKTEWKTRMIATKRVPAPTPVLDKEDPGVREYQQLVAAASVDLLFDSNLNLKDLFKSSEGDVSKIKTALNHNASLWKPKAGKLPQPLSIEEILFVQKYDALDTEFTKLVPTPSQVIDAALRARIREQPPKVVADQMDVALD